MISTNISGSNIIKYACTLRGTIAGGYDIGGLDAFKGSRTSEAKRPKANINRVTKTEDADTTLAKIKFVLDEIEDVAKVSPVLRIHFLDNIYEAKEKIFALKVK
jgi:hypothetical protein